MKKLPVDHIHVEVKYAVNKTNGILRLVEMNISIVDIDNNEFPIFIYNHEEVSMIAYSRDNDSFDKITIPINRYEPLNDCRIIGVSRSTELSNNLIEIVDHYDNGETLYTYLIDSYSSEDGDIIYTKAMKYSKFITPYIYEASSLATDYEVFVKAKEG